jgi:hypothetical protein
MAEGPGADDRDRVPWLDRRHRRPVPRRRQHVPQEDRPLVVDVLRDGKEVDVGNRDADELRMGSGQLAAEQPRAEHPPSIAQLRLPAPAEPAGAAGDVGRGHHAVPDPEPRHGLAGVLHDAHRLVADDVAALERRLPVQEMKIRATDRGDPDARTMASSGSTTAGAGTLPTTTRPPPSCTTAVTGLAPSARADRSTRAGAGLVEVFGRHRLRKQHELVGCPHAPDDRRQVAFELQLALHHPFDGIELAGDHVPPPRVRSGHE